MSLSNSRSTPPPMTLTQLMSQYHAQKQERHREDVSYSSDSSLDIDIPQSPRKHRHVPLMDDLPQSPIKQASKYINSIIF